MNPLECIKSTLQYFVSEPARGDEASSREFEAIPAKADFISVDTTSAPVKYGHERSTISTKTFHLEPPAVCRNAIFTNNTTESEQRAPESEDIRAVKQVLLYGNSNTTDARMALTDSIKNGVNVINNLVLRASVKIDALDWNGCVRDCDNVLNRVPDHRLAILLRTIALVKAPIVGNIPDPIEAIVDGIFAASRFSDDRFATLVKYGVTERCNDKAVEDVSKLVDADRSDRCATALLLTIHFKRWYWGEYPASFLHAVQIAEEMQKQWPNDRIAMSALYYLIGSTGKGHCSVMDFASRNVQPGHDIHHKSVIRPRLALDYPMYIQRPDFSKILK